MNNSDQIYIDQLHGAIFVQQLRYNHFNTIMPPPQAKSVWNRTNDEKSILNKLVNLYKKYYSSKAEELKVKLAELKDANVSSILTYDKNYYINEYNQRIEEIKKYLVELEAKNADNLLHSKLSFISESISLLFPNYAVDPSTLKFHKP